jgi:uncharacterized protein (DUF952 family)
MAIYHITSLSAWQQAQAAGQYTADSLASQGFIHCSTREQVLATAGRFYAGQDGLVLLCIDAQRIAVPLRYENLEGGEALFPHIYGPLELAAVEAVLPFPPNPDGSFSFPESGSILH